MSHTPCPDSRQIWDYLQYIIHIPKRTWSQEATSQVWQKWTREWMELFTYSSLVHINHCDKPRVLCHKYLRPSPSTVGKCQQKWWILGKKKKKKMAFSFIPKAEVRPKQMSNTFSAGNLFSKKSFDSSGKISCVEHENVSKSGVVSDSNINTVCLYANQSFISLRLFTHILHVFLNRVWQNYFLM